MIGGLSNAMTGVAWAAFEKSFETQQFRSHGPLSLSIKKKKLLYIYTVYTCIYSYNLACRFSDIILSREIN